MLEKTSLVLLSVLAVGCVEDVDPLTETDERIAEITENLLAAGYGPDHIEIVEIDEPLYFNGTELRGDGPQVFVEGDVHVTLEASRELLATDDESFRQWQTPSLVTNGTTICLVRAMDIVDQVGPAIYGPLTTDMATGVSYARWNYNNLNIGLDFELRDGTLTLSGGMLLDASQAVGCDHFISFVRDYTGINGSGFPAGGAPYPLVTMGTDADNQTTEHIATHEIGHAIGLRHSDWLTRISCNTWDPEPQLGATQIPGTDFHTTDSVMAACMPPTTDGEFRGDDVLALESLY